LGCRYGISKRACRKRTPRMSEISFLPCQEYFMGFNSLVFGKTASGTISVNPSNPVKKFSFMGIEKRENREILQEYMKYCLGVTHLAMSGIQAEFYRILAFVMWMEKETAMELKLASETEIKNISR